MPHDRICGPFERKHALIITLAFAVEECNPDKAFFSLDNLSSRSMTLALAQPLTEIIFRNLPEE
jgi:hypothetical protein